jgi:hypothetical protein
MRRPPVSGAVPAGIPEAGSNGISHQKVLPWPGSLSTPMVPPMASVS